MVELKNWHKFLALGVIVITLTVASYLVVSGLDSNTIAAGKPELPQQQPQAAPEKHNQQQPTGSPNLSASDVGGQVASSTVSGAKIVKNDGPNDEVNQSPVPAELPASAGPPIIDSLPPSVPLQQLQDLEKPTSSANPPSEQQQQVFNTNTEPVVMTQASTQAPQDPTETEAWQQFKLSYNKNYPSSEEELKRRDTFNENRKFILSFNEKRTAQFTLGVNQFADLTRDEINQLYFSPPAPIMDPPPSFVLKEQSTRSDGQVDWRNLTREPVMDQGSCRDSAVFAVVASVESAYNRKYLPPVNVKLSEQQLLDCMMQLQPTNVVCLGKFSMVQVFDHLQQHSYSLAPSEDYKKLVDMGGRVCELPPDSLLPPTKLAGYMSIHRDNILEALYVSGPLCIAIDASQSTFHFYKSGLYHDDNCSTQTYNHHAVLIGHSSATDGDSSRPSYLLRNSFGINWGESGYMRLLKDEQRNKCLPQNLAILPMIAS